MAMQVVIVGGGAVGTSLASLLRVGGHRVRVIEVRQEDILRLHRDLSADVVVTGDGTDPAVLEAAGIRQAHVVAAVTGQERAAGNRYYAPLVPGGLLSPRICGWLAHPTSDRAGKSHAMPKKWTLPLMCQGLRCTTRVRNLCDVDRLSS